MLPLAGRATNVHLRQEPDDPALVRPGRVSHGRDGPPSATTSSLRSERRVVGGEDPRLASVPAAHGRLMALQRSAGNRAVASLVGGRPSVQRMDVQINELTSEVRMADTGASLSPSVIAMLLRAIQAASARAGVPAQAPGSTEGPAASAGGGATSPSSAATPPVPEEAP